MSMTAGNVVFVGNIPYDATEKQMADIFHQIGTVRSFKLVLDPETNQPKGYGFCEFHDPETAASAVRNLNNFPFGARKLRVEFPSNDPRGRSDSSNDGIRHAPSSLMHNNPTPTPPPPSSAVSLSALQSQSAYRPMNMPSAAAIVAPNGLPSSASLPANPAAASAPSIIPGPAVVSAPATISKTSPIAKTLSAFPAKELLDIVEQLKTVVHVAPDEAKNLLKATPALSYAVFQILLLLNMVDARVLQQVLQNAAQKQQRKPAQAPPPTSDPSYNALVSQLMSLTPAQINMLPPEQRNQILLLKQRLRPQ
ncbi:mRNA cleavage and polyadenylation specificity factor complex subunit Ctf1 [Schizosaccharomyces japonicus yFS275]|uniref:mRNA cleavage and polyadenylation specificity factor complex subunit Ctf1 n=1 Tax=Schizosaccharomyces japonicus (strain yFS275 / FY16936) TaxID=402676 RepID=B6K5P6_SCHJY|nr:mRNA cleavage and polyadenylation specificity factor complex subunit Ctf1 [Schizosaccharomyces japonicus yFS275]EEB08850.1 mRNA cleavage and polyadenylation specificity factor complex subunit Ctf1 [Schizosaccharomyces japonicus yFS275]